MRKLSKNAGHQDAKLPTTAGNHRRESRVTSLTGCRGTHLQFADEMTPGVLTVLPAIAHVFACKFKMFLPSKTSNFACELRAN